MSTWIVTATGAEVDLRTPNNNTLSAADIAHSLALINRFNGHTTRPYSVAQHSLLVMELMRTEFGIVQPAPLLAALLHDAHEAYTGDVSTPVKFCLGWSWREFEDPWQQRVARRFGIEKPATAYSSLIKNCDVLALACEQRDLLPPPDATNRPWPILAGVKTPGWVDLNRGHQLDYQWQDWRDVFLEQFAELYYAVHGDKLLTTARSEAEAHAAALAAAAAAAA